MNQQLGTWIVIGFSILGISAAIIAFLRTPKEKRGLKASFRRAISIEERLLEYPTKAEAVIIKGNKKLAQIKFAPALIFFLFFIGLAEWLKDLVALHCTRVFDINTVQLALFVACYAIPFGVLIISLFLLRTGIKTLKTGYYPPLETVVFADTIATKGLFSLSRGVIAVLFPFFAIYFINIGNDLYQGFTQGSATEMTKRIESKCTNIVQLP